MKARLDNDELLRFADAYLRKGFPNPDRIGCPAEEQLRELAENPSRADVALTEHISCCSRCYQHYAELIHAQKAVLSAVCDGASRRSNVMLFWRRSGMSFQTGGNKSFTNTWASVSPPELERGSGGAAR